MSLSSLSACTPKNCSRSVSSTNLKQQQRVWASFFLQVLTIAVLSILLTAPTGAAAIGLTGPKLLKQSGVEDDDEVKTKPWISFVHNLSLFLLFRVWDNSTNHGFIRHVHRSNLSAYQSVLFLVLPLYLASCFVRLPTVVPITQSLTLHLLSVLQKAFLCCCKWHTITVFHHELLYVAVWKEAGIEMQTENRFLNNAKYTVHQESVGMSYVAHPKK